MTEKSPSFEQAINTASLWCNSWEQGELSDEVLADLVAELVKSKGGARGFFAFTLSGDCPIIDRLPEPLVIQLRSVGKSIVDLTVRNLAMSSAMALQHERNGNFKQKLCSERISLRCIELLRVLETNSVKERVEKLIKAISGKGEDLEFLNRWGYDEDQKQAIFDNLNNVAFK